MALPTDPETVCVDGEILATNTLSVIDAVAEPLIEPVAVTVYVVIV
jgi:hypothetical protein